MTVAVIGANRNAWAYLYDTISKEHMAERSMSRASYYFTDGTPAGVWRGSGLAGVNLEEGALAEEEHLERLFGDGQDPITESTLGKAFEVPPTLKERVDARVKALDSTLTGSELDTAIDEITTEEMSRKQKQSVAGFEFVFSPPKSVSAWWALADPDLKDEIRQAHQRAIDATIKKLETDIVRTRTGKNGAAQMHVKGIIAALFDHWDSREGDPQLHTHMLVSNRVQGADGKWRTIDSRWSLMPAIATAGEFYDTVLMDELSNKFGVAWTTEDVLKHPNKYRTWLKEEQRKDSPAARHQYSLNAGTKSGSVRWQLERVPFKLIDEYSTRAKRIRENKDQQIADYVKKYGQQPSTSTIIKMRQQATFRTRRSKTVLSLKQLTTSWRARARPIVGDSFLFADRLLMKSEKRAKNMPLWSFRRDDVRLRPLQDCADSVLCQLAKDRSTWGRRNAETMALRCTAGWRFRSPDDRDRTVQAIVDLALSAAIPLTPKNHLRVPNKFTTAEGEDMFQPVMRDLYTTREVWDAEERLLAAGRATHGVIVEDTIVGDLITQPTGAEGRILSEDQAGAVTNILTSGRPVDVLVGPAGAGKTTSLEKLREIWEAQHGAGTVRGLAPTARAADVLADSLGIGTENTAKWLLESDLGTTEKDGFSYQLNSGDLLIVDESSIAGTMALDRLRQQAEVAGAKLLLVGDWAQLSAVDAGGAFGLLASDRHDVAELVNLHRFKAEWEADASKLLRLGKTAGLTPYIENERVTHGLSETIINDAVEAWKDDEMAVDPKTGDTLVSLLIAPTNDMVDQLNEIARQWRIENGDIDETRHVALATGVASPGDRIVTRQNARHLRTDHDRWVHNNDEWVIEDISEQGDIVASSGDEIVVLPAEYAAEHVQLAYATTAHRSQGRTVDTAHTIVDSSANRETFYVSMTRGKHSNRAYVVVDEDGTLGDPTATGITKSWRELLDRVVLTSGGDLAAHDTQRAEADRIGSIRQLVDEYQTLTAHELEREYFPTLQELGLIADENVESPYLGPLLANMRRLEVIGKPVPETITQLLAERDLGDARDVLAVLHNRVRHHLEDLAELDQGRTDYGRSVTRTGVAVDDDNNRAALLRLYRALRVIEATGADAEHVLRDTAASMPNSNIDNAAAYLTAMLQREYRINDSDLKPRVHDRKLAHGALIAGIVEESPKFQDAEFTAALHDREIAIQLRAEYLVDQAIGDNEPWLKHLGAPQPGFEEDWRARAVTVACYRDLYSVQGDDPLGREMAHSRNRERDRQMAEAALRQNLRPEQIRPATVPPAYTMPAPVQRPGM